MKTVFFVATVLLSTFGGSRLAAAEQLQDLSPYQTVKLDVNLRTLDSGDVPPEIFYDVPNHYTNSIVCSVDLAIPVSKNGVDGVFEVSQTDVVIFPASGFNKPVSYKINRAQIPANRTVRIGFTDRQTQAATCTGWKPGKRLPRRTCLALNPEHDQICVNVRAAGRDYYPVVQGQDAHLGDCGC